MRGLHHLMLYCRNTDASRDWYASVGFDYPRGYHGMHWFTFGSAEIMLHPAEPDTAAAVPIALHAAVRDVDALFRHVVALGLRPSDHQHDSQPLTAPVTRAWGDREFELLDPDGYNWAFTQVNDV